MIQQMIGGWEIRGREIVHLCGGRTNKTIRFGWQDYCSRCNTTVPRKVKRLLKGSVDTPKASGMLRGVRRTLSTGKLK